MATSTTRRLASILPLLLLALLRPWPGAAQPPPLPSLQGFSGLWDMPTARVLPDWRARLAGSAADPYAGGGAALGLFDRLELYGQLTRVGSRPGFPGEDFGAYKDRLAGAKLVVWSGQGERSQLALGLHDVFGTGLFQGRYLVFSHAAGPLDLTAGLAQGVLGGDHAAVDMAEDSDQEAAAGRFQLSSPWRRTGPFAGLRWTLSPGLWLAAEWSPIDSARLFGYDRQPLTPLSVGLKARPWPWLDLGAGLSRGRDPAGTLAVSFPLGEAGWLPLSRRPPTQVLEKRRMQAAQLSDAGDDAGLAALLAAELAEQGFGRVKVQVGGDSVRAEAENRAFQTDGRALARLAAALDALAPPRFVRWRLVLTRPGRPPCALTAPREHLRDFLDSRLDEAGFLAFADQSGDDPPDWSVLTPVDPPAWPEEELIATVEPRLRAFLENRTGFLKTKGVLAPVLAWAPWAGSLVRAEAEVAVWNEFDGLDYPDREDEAAATDVVRYEERRGTRLTGLTFSQAAAAPWGGLGRVSAGWLSSAFAGAGAETFRFVAGDRLGLGLEAALARKRDPASALGLDPASDRLFHNEFVNLYVSLWPDQGVDLTVKAGRFLGGDPGVRLELRRMLRGWTAGLWTTMTDASGFRDPDNRSATDVGVFVRLPLSCVSGRESPHRLRYAAGTFTSDQGRVLDQPLPLVPADLADLPGRARLEEMRVP